jgi:cytoskeletal protein CcmA (bactofilin family)
MRSSRETVKDDPDGPPERRGPRSLAVISDGAVMNGILRSTASIRLDGSFRGTIMADDELIIAPGGRVEARVKARRVVIAGDFRGDMVVLEELEIAPTGRFAGTLYQKDPVLRVGRGGRFEARSIFVDDLDAVAAGWAAPPLSAPSSEPEGRSVTIHHPGQNRTKIGGPAGAE